VSNVLGRKWQDTGWEKRFFGNVLLSYWLSVRAAPRSLEKQSTISIQLLASKTCYMAGFVFNLALKAILITPLI
jgi:hypothetical protein